MIPSPPKDLDANLDYRAELLALCDESPELQAQVMERCRDDIVYWIDAFCWQYNPNSRGRKVDPFICYEFQERAIRRTMKRLLEHRLPVVWQKSRDLGATWMELLIQDHQCLFLDRQKFLNLSHSEQAVYRPNDPDTLFWKLDFIHNHLPDWMARGVVKQKLTFWFPATKSATTGGATTERSGVGGRGPVMCDEFAKHPKGWEILGQTVDTGPQLFVSTHYDMASAFYDLTKRPDTFLITMHWSDHPDRRRGLYRSDPALPKGYEILDTGFEYPPQCSACSGLVPGTEIGQPTPCCEERGVARHYQFITDGKPSGGPHPGIRSPYYDHECVKRGNERDVAMHLDINPQGSQSQFFDSLMIRQRIVEFCCEPFWVGTLNYDPDSGQPLELVTDPDGPIKLWVHPTGKDSVPPGRYGAGSDLSTGYGATPSVLTIGEAITGRKVCEFATAHLPPERFAVAAAALCWLFKDESGQSALLNWETNGPGAIFGKTIKEIGYRRVLYRTSEQLFHASVTSDIAGWHNSPRTMRLLFDNYKAALTNRAFRNHSEKSMLECTHYRFSDRRDAVEHPKDVGGDKPEEARSNHGDRAMADALCWMALQKLGAGKSLAAVTQAAPPAVGSLQWRMDLVAHKERQELDRKPIRVAGRVRR